MVYNDALKEHDKIRFKQPHQCGDTEAKITGFSKDGKHVFVEESNYGGWNGGLTSSTSYSIKREAVISVRRWIPVEKLKGEPRSK